MLSFGAPLYLLAAGAAAAGVLTLHFFARARRPTPLPTARFLPDPPESAVARARRPADLALLLLRVLALLLVGAGFARPLWTPARSGTQRVVLLDLSRAVADPAAADDSARRWVGARDTLIGFDSAVLAPGAPLLGARPRGSLAAALLAGQRAARSLPADSAELVLVSPLLAEEWDAALPAVRALWPAAIRLVRVAAVEPPAVLPIELRTDGDDPLVATLRLLQERTGARSGEPAGVRVLRREPSSADSAWAGEAARVLVHWPRTEAGERDSIGAVVAGDLVVVAPFIRSREPEPGRVIARWADGRAAATERATGAGCVRDVAIPLPEEGDVALRESVQRLLERFAAPCGGAWAAAPLDSAHVALLAGSGGSAQSLSTLGLARSEGEGTERGTGKAEVLCWGAALLLLTGELLLRRRGREA